MNAIPSAPYFLFFSEFMWGDSLHRPYLIFLNFNEFAESMFLITNHPYIIF